MTTKKTTKDTTDTDEAADLSPEDQHVLDVAKENEAVHQDDLPLPVNYALEDGPVNLLDPRLTEEERGENNERTDPNTYPDPDHPTRTP